MIFHSRMNTYEVRDLLLSVLPNRDEWPLPGERLELADGGKKKCSPPGGQVTRPDPGPLDPNPTPAPGCSPVGGQVTRPAPKDPNDPAPGCSPPGGSITKPKIAGVASESHEHAVLLAALRTDLRAAAAGKSLSPS